MNKLVLPDDYRDFFSNSMYTKIAKKHSESLLNRKENENYHNSYYFEQEFYGYVERGDIEGLYELLKQVPEITEGEVAYDSLRQAKNILITTIAIITRHAITGGLDIETAYQLSDAYIQEAERLSDFESVSVLNAVAVMDFTKRVSETKFSAGMSLEIFKAMQYISNHVNKPLSVKEVADYLQIERSTLSKKFKRELGFNISTYIMRRKLEEAKSLLNFSDRTISEISEYLCFSSQSYFQNVFKKKYGMTPKEYRASC